MNSKYDTVSEYLGGVTFMLVVTDEDWIWSQNPKY